jgi:hypothetical protein
MICPVCDRQLLISPSNQYFTCEQSDHFFDLSKDTKYFSIIVEGFRLTKFSAANFIEQEYVIDIGNNRYDLTKIGFVPFDYTQSYKVLLRFRNNKSFT